MTDKEKIEVLEKENKLLKEQIELLKELKQKNTPSITTYPTYPYYPYYKDTHREWWDYKVYCNTPLDQCTSTSVTAKTGDAE